MKIRLHKGPFGGKIYEGDGRNEIIIGGPKRQTRKQKHESFIRWNNTVGPDTFYSTVPRVEARYRISTRVYSNLGSIITAPCYHPDGSIFYEYIEGSKREYY